MCLWQMNKEIDYDLNREASIMVSLKVYMYRLLTEV